MQACEYVSVPEAGCRRQAPAGIVNNKLLGVAKGVLLGGKGSRKYYYVPKEASYFKYPRPFLKSLVALMSLGFTNSTASPLGQAPSDQKATTVAMASGGRAGGAGGKQSAARVAGVQLLWGSDFSISFF